MKRKILNLFLTALGPASLLVLAGCSSTAEEERSTSAAYVEGKPGGVFVQTGQINATVTAIDKAARKVTLVSSKGKSQTFKAGPDVSNFDQIQLGDRLRVTATQEMVVYMAAAGGPPPADVVGPVAVSPQGAKPGTLMAETVQVTAKVVAIDQKRRKATLQLPDGSRQTVQVRKDVDLTQRKVGEEVVMQMTESMVIAVEKP